MQQRPRALVVTRNYPPLTGGMERLNYHAYQGFSTKYEVALCGPRGATEFLVDAVATVRESPLTPLAKYLVHVQWQAFRSAQFWRPSLVYSGSGLTAPAALLAGKVARAKTACFLHGLDIVADNLLYRTAFLPAIRCFDTILVNSRHTRNLAIQAGVRPERISIIHPGVELPAWNERDVARARFRSRFDFGDRPLILSAGRLTQRKGLAEFIRHALPGIIARTPDTKLVVIGKEPQQALRHQQGVTAGIQAAIQEMGVGKHVTLLGAQDECSLSDAYFAADVMIFPVLELPGDVEGFGMVAAEAAAHGLPTVGFTVGGIPDAIAPGISGELSTPGDYADLQEKIIRILAYDTTISSLHCRKHAEQFEWSIFTRKLLDAVA